MVLVESFNALAFRDTWRTYQQKLLKNFDRHINDYHFHVIAPPGSGKTILGLEIIRRLGKKTLILAPSLAIRNQWERRLQTFFTENENFDAISFDLKNPKAITCTTYQALYTLYASFKTEKAYSRFFKTHTIETVVLDEAHHLKNAWWKSLIALKSNPSLFIVALTATPPYDSSKTEISKYFSLCGSIDDEITVPDLVREKNLSPHQDYVYFSQPEDLEINFIAEYRLKIAQFKNQLIEDESFIHMIQNHRFYKNTIHYFDDIYANIPYFSSLLIFLNQVGVVITPEHMEVLGFHKKEVIRFPELTLDWLQILLQHLLVADRAQLSTHEDYLMSLEKTLRRLNVFEKKRLNLIGNQLLYKSLAFSPSKLKSIVRIINAEYESLGNDLRCVVLTDYIRKAFLNLPSNAITRINKIGVLPIFHYIRASNTHQLAVLTGSIVIVHQSMLDAFNKIEPLAHFSFTPLEADASYLLVNTISTPIIPIVAIITQLLEEGIIKVLIGTKALLGQGWDAPSINTLILASFVGSFVSSNQMRGRAIRKDPSKPKKTGNIWHLACVDPTVDSGGRDIEILKQRFEAFVGITNTTIPFISNGFDRLNFPETIEMDAIDTLNENTLKNAKKRSAIADKWATSIGRGTTLTKQFKLNYLDEKPYQAKKQAYAFDALRFFITELALSIVLFYFEFFIDSLNLILNRKFTYLVYAFIITLIFRFGFKMYKALVLYITHGYLYKRIGNMGKTILYTLNDLNILTTAINTIEVYTEQRNKGDIICYLKGATHYENSLFTGILTEVLNPIESPRYLIVKTNRFRKKINMETFYPVPELFATNKQQAQRFQEHWTTFLGRNTLVFTQRPKGRKLLLKARLAHIYNAFTLEISKEETVWR